MPSVCSISTLKHGISSQLSPCGIGADIEGKIAVASIRDVHESFMVEKLAERGAAGVVIFQATGPMLASRVRYPHSSIPCVSVNSKLGLNLLRSSSRTKLSGNLIVRSKLSIARGRNLIATPRRMTTEAMYVAHRDSRLFSPGAVDNATGSAYLCSLGKMLKKPPYSILSTDAEEYGLLGASDFIKRNRDLSRSVKVINLDSVGQGRICLVTRSRGGELSSILNSKIADIGRKAGTPLGWLSIPRGSDSDVFASHSFDSSWIRAYPSPTATTVNDTIEHVDPSVVRKALRLLNTLARSVL
ncbi:MAG: M28 family peptidase [Nitrososphaerales archaeon]